MAAMNVLEDQSTGSLVLRPNVGRRLLGSLGNAIWVLVLLAFFLFPTLTRGQVNVESLIIIVVVILFSFVPSLGGLFSTTTAFDRSSRTLTRTTSFFFLPFRSTVFPFSELRNIEFQLYRQSSGRSSHQAYRVNAILNSGGRLALNWDGQQDEMLALAQKVAALTGAELLDQSVKPSSQLDELMERARQLGVPIPDVKTINPAPPSTEEEAVTIPATPSGSVPAPFVPELAKSEDDLTSTPGMEARSSEPSRGLNSMSIAGLEKIVAADTTDSDARYMLARAYHAQGNLDRAIAMYQETLKVDNTNAEAQNDLGVAYSVRGKRTDAEAAYRRAIALDPFSFNAHLNLALLLRAMNRATDASNEFLQARQNAPGSMEKQIAENASSGMKYDPRLSGSKLDG